jgi:hypothetical protein
MKVVGEWQSYAMASIRKNGIFNCSGIFSLGRQTFKKNLLDELGWHL